MVTLELTGWVNRRERPGPLRGKSDHDHDRFSLGGDVVEHRGRVSPLDAEGGSRQITDVGAHLFADQLEVHPSHSSQSSESGSTG